MSLLITHPGILSLLQDGGRSGYSHWGITSGGPMDTHAFCWANLLCENPLGTSAIEIAVGGFSAVFQQPCRYAITGAEVAVTVNGIEQDIWRSWSVEAGDVIKIQYARKGVRCYLAISGGFEVEPKFGSCSTVVREGIGGLNGGPLRANDEIPYLADSEGDCLQAAASERPHYSRRTTLRLLPGYQNSLFSREQQTRFFSSEFTVTGQCDRMGYRLSGPGIHADHSGILSEGICLGSVQVPPDGDPIVMMADHQTIGGYPKIGTVLSMDLGRLAQLKQGDTVNFAAITRQDALKALSMMRERLQNPQLLLADETP